MQKTTVINACIMKKESFETLFPKKGYTWLQELRSKEEKLNIKQHACIKL